MKKKAYRVGRGGEEKGVAMLVCEGKLERDD